MDYCSLYEAVHRYLALAGMNIGSNDELQFMIRGSQVWKEIQHDILKLTIQQWVSVNKSTPVYYIDLPKCCDKFINVGKIDGCKKHVVFNSWDGLPTLPMPICATECTCGDGIKECIEQYEETVENITISAGTFPKTTKKRIYENGEVYIETSTPTDKVTKSGTNNGYDYIVDKTYLCKLDINPCGCVSVSQQNLEVVTQCCAEDTISRCTSICNKYFKQPTDKGLTYNESGYMKFDMRLKRVYLYGDIPDAVLVSFQTSGTLPEEEMLPSFVLTCFNIGMDYYNTHYSKTKDRFEKRTAKQDWNIAKNKLRGELPRNQIDVSTFHENTHDLFYKFG